MRATMYSLTNITIEGSCREIETLHAMLRGACLVGNGEYAPLRTELYQSLKVQPDPIDSGRWTPCATTDPLFSSRFLPKP